MSKFKFSRGMGVRFIPGVGTLLLIPMETYTTCDFPGLIQPMTFMRYVLLKLYRGNLLFIAKDLQITLNTALLPQYTTYLVGFQLLQIECVFKA